MTEDAEMVAAPVSMGLSELIGRRMRCEFTLPEASWPIRGWPAWVIIEAVDMPMVKMRSAHAGESMWVNASIIQRLWE